MLRTKRSPDQKQKFSASISASSAPVVAPVTCGARESGSRTAFRSAPSCAERSATSHSFKVETDSRYLSAIVGSVRCLRQANSLQTTFSFANRHSLLIQNVGVHHQPGKEAESCPDRDQIPAILYTVYCDPDNSFHTKLCQPAPDGLGLPLTKGEWATWFVQPSTSCLLLNYVLVTVHVLRGVEILSPT